MAIDSIITKTFPGDVVVYAAFLSDWFPSERWTSREQSIPLQSGVLTSAEIAYVLLRFGEFHTGDWDAWRTGGFVALDTAVNKVLVQIKGLLGDKERALSAESRAAEVSTDEERLQGWIAILSGESSGEVSSYTRCPLLYALAVHVFLNRERPDADIVSFCRRLNLIVA